jgi:hypothetical protein
MAIGACEFKAQSLAASVNSCTTTFENEVRASAAGDKYMGVSSWSGLESQGRSRQYASGVGRGGEEHAAGEGHKRKKKAYFHFESECW